MNSLPPPQERSEHHPSSHTLIAGFAVAAILVHLSLRFGFRLESGACQIPLLATLAVGGIPLVYGLLRKVLRREFGSDLLAGISIVTSVLLHEYLAGIRPGAPGFKTIIIQPEPVGDLTWARAEYDSIRGRISSEWHQSATQFDLQVAIPANTTATVYLPAKDIPSVTEGGQALAKITGLKSVKMEAGRAVLEIGSGSYHFESGR